MKLFHMGLPGAPEAWGMGFGVVNPEGEMADVRHPPFATTPSPALLRLPCGRLACCGLHRTTHVPISLHPDNCPQVSLPSCFLHGLKSCCSHPQTQLFYDSGALAGEGSECSHYSPSRKWSNKLILLMATREHRWDSF